VAVRAKEMHRWKSLSVCGTGEVGVLGSEEYGSRPPAEARKRRSRKAAAMAMVSRWV
jgi:hypothetical protein